MKKFLFLTLLISKLVFSEEIKLQCQSKLIGTVNYQTIEEKVSEELISISSVNEDIVFFFLSGLLDGNIQTISDKDWKVHNFSNRNQWEIITSKIKPDRYLAISSKIDTLLHSKT
jgi:DNA-directed RNA polymerase delta subunit